MNTPSDMRNDGGLSGGEAYRLGWTLVWPVALSNYCFWQLENIFEVTGSAATALNVVPEPHVQPHVWELAC
jgi:hypothetical protein